MTGDCNCTCPITGAHDPDCAVYGPPQEPAVTSQFLPSHGPDSMTAWLR